MVPAAARAASFPIYFVEPCEDDGAAGGEDAFKATGRGRPGNGGLDLEAIGDGRKSIMRSVSVLGSSLDAKFGQWGYALEARRLPPTCPTQ